MTAEIDIQDTDPPIPDPDATIITTAESLTLPEFAAGVPIMQYPPFGIGVNLAPQPVEPIGRVQDVMYMAD
jgi:hypothetical protein